MSSTTKHHHAQVANDDHIVEREPTMEEIQQALSAARQEGLPGQYNVQWDRTGRKYFTYQQQQSQQQRKFTTLPQALAHAVSIGLLPPEQMPESHQDRELSPSELETAWKEARQQGLPESFTCRWDNKKRRRVWFTPNGKPIKGGIPAALKVAVELGLISKDSLPPSTNNNSKNKKNLTVEQKIQLGLQEAQAHGLDGWNVVWDDKYHQKVFVSPDGARKLYGLDKAVAYAVKKGWLPTDKMPPQFQKDRELTEEETQKAWKAAKKKNLPETWTVVWDSKQHRRVWVAPDNRRCDCISKAVAYSCQKGWLDPAKVTKSQKTSLTQQEEKAALAEARERGLPSCFQVRWNPKKNQKQWIAGPTGKVCNSIPAALAYATKHGLVGQQQQPPPPSTTATKRKRKQQTRIISPRPLKQAALTQLVDAALADDFQELVQQAENTATTTTNTTTAADRTGAEQDVDDDDHGGDFGWAAFHRDDEEEESPTKTTDSDLAPADVEAERDDPGKTCMSQHEIDTAMEQAKLRGLPTGWTVSWDVKRKRRAWVSPCGKYKCRGIPSALQKSVDLGLISEDIISTTDEQDEHSLSTDARTASAIRNAKHRGLPDSWTVEFLEDGRKSLRWRSPDGRVAKTLVEALKMSVDMGILAPDKMPAEYRERTLTTEEVERSLKEASSRGLPPGWSVTWNSSRRQKIWISPDGKTKCDSINKALKASVRLGLLSQEVLPTTLQAREMTQEEIDSALEDAREKGLTCDGWRLEWNAKKGCRRWISPDNKRSHSIAHDGIGEINVYIVDGEVSHAGFAIPPRGGYLIHEEWGGWGTDHEATEAEQKFALEVYKATTIITGTKPLYLRW